MSASSAFAVIPAVILNSFQDPSGLAEGFADAEWILKRVQDDAAGVANAANTMESAR